MSRTQNMDVFARCTELAKELDAGGRTEDAVAVLRALGVYLDSLPATPDASCKKMTFNLLDKLSAKSRESQRKLGGGA